MKLTADWLHAPASLAVMEALGDGFYVGGCVRNTLLGEVVCDIDIATPLVPDEVVARLENVGLKVVPTGLKHGTVTAIADGKPLEVTTFRADVATDGRHAEVAFTTDMLTDARRRDFTMNALYADRSGALHDPIGGLPDLMARRVRFIGEPADRIREDYLRILRFFRFHAWYGAEGIDPEGLAASADLADGLSRLARERVGWEFRKLLSAPNPAAAMASMARTGILARCVPGANAEMLAPIVHVETALGIAPDWRTRLAAIGGERPDTHLRLSRDEGAFLAKVRGAAGHPAAEAAYRFGPEAAEAAVVVQAATTGHLPTDDWQEEIALGANAKFPLRAHDLLERGWSSGRQLGEALAAAQSSWISSRFTLDRAELIAQVEAQ